MGIYNLEMFNTQGEDTALADLNLESSGTTGNFIVPFDGRILKVTLLWSGEAVSSLAEYVRVELTSNIWSPNLHKFSMVMANIRTAPAFPISPFEWPMDQPVLTTQSVQGQFAYDNGSSPVTCDLHVWGTFSGP